MSASHAGSPDARRSAEELPGGWPDSVRVVDSHTEGEPTRVILEGFPQPAGDTMAERRDDLASRFDALRRAIVGEPRGHGAVIGALLTPPVEPESLAGIIFFDNGGYLGMCGHGLIGVARTFEFLGRLPGATARFDTPVGPVEAQLGDGGVVRIENVPARCDRLDVSVEVPGLGEVRGDVAWGGNSFFLTRLSEPELKLENVAELQARSLAIRSALERDDVRDRDGTLVDHVELFGPPAREDADSRNFVLCPSGEFDRSPCGTGTSAKMASLHARGELLIGAKWRQESITGGLFVGSLESRNGELIPHIEGRAFVTGEARLRFAADDPLRAGLL